MTIADPPYIAETEAYFVFGVDASTSLVNLSPNAGGNGTFVGGGAGEFSTNWAKLNINYSLDSGVSYTGFNKTVVSVAEFQKDQHSAVVAPQIEISIINGAYRVATTSSGYRFAAGDFIPLDTPQFMAVTSADTGGNDVAYLGRSGVFQSASSAAGAVTAGNIVFGPRGGRDSISDTTGHKHYLGLIYDRELSSSELAEVYEWAATELAKKYILLA